MLLTESEIPQNQASTARRKSFHNFFALAKSVTWRPAWIKTACLGFSVSELTTAKLMPSCTRANIGPISTAETVGNAYRLSKFLIERRSPKCLSILSLPPPTAAGLAAVAKMSYVYDLPPPGELRAGGWMISSYVILVEGRNRDYFLRPEEFPKFFGSINWSQSRFLISLKMIWSGRRSR